FLLPMVSVAGAMSSLVHGGPAYRRARTKRGRPHAAPPRSRLGADKPAPGRCSGGGPGFGENHAPPRHRPAPPPPPPPPAPCPPHAGQPPARIVRPRSITPPTLCAAGAWGAAPRAAPVAADALPRLSGPFRCHELGA